MCRSYSHKMQTMYQINQAEAQTISKFTNNILLRKKI